MTRILDGKKAACLVIAMALFVVVGFADGVMLSVDYTAPTTIDDGPADNVTIFELSPVTINLTATDNTNGSGVNFIAYCTYREDEAPCDPATGTIDYDNETQVALTCGRMCRYFVRYFSVDIAGNNESIKSTNKINMVIPEVPGAPPGEYIPLPTESRGTGPIMAGACTDIEFLNYSVHGVKSIHVCFARAVANVDIQLTVKTVVALLPSGETYKFIDVYTGLTDDYITSATLLLAVPKSWIAEKSVAFRKIALNRWYNDSWEALPTEWTAADQNYRYFTANSTGLSLFAIAGPRAACPSACPSPTQWSKCVNGMTSMSEYACGPDTSYDCEASTITRTCSAELLCPPCPPSEEWGLCIDNLQARTEWVCTAQTEYECAQVAVARPCELAAACPACPDPSPWTDCVENRQSRVAYTCGPDTHFECIQIVEGRGCIPPEGLALLALALLLIGALIVALQRKRLPKLPAIKPSGRGLLKQRKPKYVCSICGKREMLVHWCERCGKEVCIEHIHKVGTKLWCERCMKKRGVKVRRKG